jgi:tetratricopeptide (TPR) repeat protein
MISLTRRYLTLTLPAFAAVAFMGIAGAVAAAADPIADCNQTDNLDRQIAGCTAFIRSGKGLGGNLAIAYTNRGIAFGAKGKLKQSLADLTEAVRLSPDESVTFYNRGNAYYDLGRYQEAVADYTKALEIEQDFALALFNRGIAYELVGDKAKSMDDYRAVLAIDPDAEAARARLSKLEQPQVKR